MEAWQFRQPDSVCPVLLGGRIWIKIRDGTVMNRLVYVVMGIDMEGARDIFGLSVGTTGGEPAKFWHLGCVQKRFQRVWVRWVIMAKWVRPRRI